MEKTMNRTDGKTEPLHSFNEALTAARENIGPSFKEAIVESTGHLSTLADEARKQLVGKSKDASKAVNQHVHSQPWSYIAGASIAGLALGYFLARRK